MKAQGRLAWWAFRSASFTLSVSPALTAASVAAGLPAGRFRDVPNGVDPVRFAPPSPGERAALRQELGLPADGPIVLFVGIFSRDKQPQVLFEAWLKLQTERRTGLDAGVRRRDQSRGSSRPTRSLAAGIRDAAGPLRLRRPLAVGAADAAVSRTTSAPPTCSSCRRRARACRSSLLEAMACGLPCVASRLPGSTDVMIDSGRNGQLVPSGDAGGPGRCPARRCWPTRTRPRAWAPRRAPPSNRVSPSRASPTQWLAAYHEVLATPMTRRPDILCISSIDWDFIWQGHQEIMSRAGRERAPRAVHREHRRPRRRAVSDLPRAAPAPAQLVARHQGLPRRAAEPVRAIRRSCCRCRTRASRGWINRQLLMRSVSALDARRRASRGRWSGRSCRRRWRAT